MRAQGAARAPIRVTRSTTAWHSTAEREQLILEHLPQVHLIARRIRERLPRSVSLEDLISTGVVGLIAAIDRFDSRQNVKLKTYAEFKIRGAILDSLRELDWAPRRQRHRSKQIEGAVSAAAQRLQRFPDEEEIARELKVSLERYRQWLMDTRALNMGSLQDAPADDSTHTRLKYVSDDQEKWPSRVAERSELQRLLQEAIGRMPDPERTVINLYYREQMTLREIAPIVGLHESRISQLKTQGILRLRAYVQARWTLPRSA